MSRAGAGAVDRKLTQAGGIVMSRAPITVLLFSLAIAGAALPEDSVATPADHGDAETLAARGPIVLPKRVVAFAARRVAIADFDLDGVVSSAEAQNYYAARFALMDRDRDGRLSEPEFFRVAAIRSVHALDSAFEAQPLDFEPTDLDGNGTLTSEEFMPATLGRRSRSAGAGIYERRRAVFELVDGDDDGAVSKHEFMAAGARNFVDSDADGDGKVTIGEFYGSKRL